MSENKRKTITLKAIQNMIEYVKTTDTGSWDEAMFTLASVIEQRLKHDTIIATLENDRYSHMLEIAEIDTKIKETKSKYPSIS